jgi:hypothetical protein
VIYLGDDVRQSDVWGHTATVPEEDGKQVIEVGPLPTFLIGVDQAVARSRMSLGFTRQQLPSVFGQPLMNSVALTNYFPQGARGRLTLVCPDGWLVRPKQFEFKLAGGERFERDFQIRLPFDLSNGDCPVRVDVELTAEKNYQFSIFRHLRVGLGDIIVEATSQLSDAGELLVQQRFHNHTDEPVSFRCNLFAPDRRRMRTQILELGRGEDVQTYRLPQGRQLLGQTLWIRAQEINGPRVLSFRFDATE